MLSNQYSLTHFQDNKIQKTDMMCKYSWNVVHFLVEGFNVTCWI